jgi:alpha-1,6-mannosyltransferase
MVFLPFIGLLWAGKDASWLRKFAFWGLTAGLSLGILLYAMSLVNGFGFGWINGLSAPGSVYIWYAPVGLLGLVVASLANAFSLDGLVLAKWVLRRRQVARGGHRRLADLPGRT